MIIVGNLAEANAEWGVSEEKMTDEGNHTGEGKNNPSGLALRKGNVRAWVVRPGEDAW